MGYYMTYTESFMRELEVINEKGYNTVKLCRLAGIDRKTLWRARNWPDVISLNTADKIMRALQKIPKLPYEFPKRKPRGD